MSLRARCRQQFITLFINTQPLWCLRAGRGKGYRIKKVKKQPKVCGLGSGSAPGACRPRIFSCSFDANQPTAIAFYFFLASSEEESRKKNPRQSGATVKSKNQKNGFPNNKQKTRGTGCRVLRQLPSHFFSGRPRRHQLGKEEAAILYQNLSVVAIYDLNLHTHHMVPSNSFYDTVLYIGLGCGSGTPGPVLVLTTGLFCLSPEVDPLRTAPRKVATSSTK